MTKQLSIIIVNYNGERFLKDCIESIKKTCQDISYEIVIVDNASHDNSVHILETQFSEDVILIKSEENLGFGGGNNLAVKNSIGKNILLLNNDTILLNNLKPAIEILEKEDEIGAIGIKMLDAKKSYRHSIGYFPSPKGLFKLSFLTKKDEGFNEGNFNKDRYEVDWIEASFLLTTRSVWNKIRGFDNKYFMYVEDVDICKEIQLINKKRIYLPGLSYIHFGGFNLKREGQLIKGHQIFVNKHYKGLYKQMCLICLKINKTFKKYFKKEISFND